MQNKPTNLKEKKREESLKSIIEAAKTIFVKLGYSGASMSLIAQEAKVAQGLIYHYFPSKEALWKAVKQDALDRAGLAGDFGGSEGQNFQEFLAIVCKNRFDFYEKNPKLRTIVAWEKLQSKDSELYGVDNTFKGMWHDDLVRLKDSGTIDKSIDPKLLGILIASAFSGVFEDIPKVYEASEVRKKQDEYLAMLKRCMAVFETT